MPNTLRTGRTYNGPQVLHYSRVGRWLWISDPSRNIAYVLDGHICDRDNHRNIIAAYDSAADTYDNSDDHRTARREACRVLSDERRYKVAIHSGDRQIATAWFRSASLEAIGAWRSEGTASLAACRAFGSDPELCRSTPAETICRVVML